MINPVPIAPQHWFDYGIHFKLRWRFVRIQSGHPWKHNEPCSQRSILIFFDYIYLFLSPISFSFSFRRCMVVYGMWERERNFSVCSGRLMSDRHQNRTHWVPTQPGWIPFSWGSFIHSFCGLRLIYIFFLFVSLLLPVLIPCYFCSLAYDPMIALIWNKMKSERPTIEKKNKNKNTNQADSNSGGLGTMDEL